MTPSLRALAMVTAVAASSTPTFGVPDPAIDADRTPVVDAGRPSGESCLFAEHRYRIVGKIRLGFFWAGRDDVGGARMTWRSDGGSTAIALLAGSDPVRAPRRLNQWAYVREETRSEHAEVFTLRTLADDGAESDDAWVGAAGPLFGVSCTSITPQRVNVATTTVAARDLTFRMFDRFLDSLTASPPWKGREMGRPAGASAGFLSALQHVMRVDANGPTDAAAPTRAAYVYNNSVYDLSVRRRHQLGRTQVAARTFDALTRADLAVRNRTTGDITPFAVTYVPGVNGISLPVQIFYQPSFWVRIELRLDDRADVPADPAADESVLARIRTICSQADSHRERP